MIASCVTETFKPSTASGTGQSKEKVLDDYITCMVVSKQVGGMDTHSTCACNGF